MNKSNPLNIIKNFVRQQGSPKELLMNFMQQGNNQNPMINNLIGMAREGKTKEVENFARNMFREQGRDFDKEMAEFKRFFRS